LEADGVGIGASELVRFLAENGVETDADGALGNAFGVTILALRPEDNDVWN
jgi:hypothetical protein